MYFCQEISMATKTPFRIENEQELDKFKEWIAKEIVGDKGKNINGAVALGTTIVSREYGKVFDTAGGVPVVVEERGNGIWYHLIQKEVEKVSDLLGISLSEANQTLIEYAQIAENFIGNIGKSPTGSSHRYGPRVVNVSLFDEKDKAHPHPVDMINKVRNGEVHNLPEATLFQLAESLHRNNLFNFHDFIDLDKNENGEFVLTQSHEAKIKQTELLVAYQIIMDLGIHVLQAEISKAVNDGIRYWETELGKGNLISKNEFQHKITDYLSHGVMACMVGLTRTKQQRDDLVSGKRSLPSLASMSIENDILDNVPSDAYALKPDSDLYDISSNAASGNAAKIKSNGGYKIAGVVIGGKLNKVTDLAEISNSLPNSQVLFIKNKSNIEEYLLDYGFKGTFQADPQNPNQLMLRPEAAEELGEKAIAFVAPEHIAGTRLYFYNLITNKQTQNKNTTTIFKQSLNAQLNPEENGQQSIISIEDDEVFDYLREILDKYNITPTQLNILFSLNFNTEYAERLMMSSQINQERLTGGFEKNKLSGSFASADWLKTLTSHKNWGLFIGGTKVGSEKNQLTFKTGNDALNEIKEQSLGLKKLQTTILSKQEDNTTYMDMSFLREKTLSEQNKSNNAIFNATANDYEEVREEYNTVKNARREMHERELKEKGVSNIELNEPLLSDIQAMAEALGLDGVYVGETKTRNNGASLTPKDAKTLLGSMGGILYTLGLDGDGFKNLVPDLVISWAAENYRAASDGRYVPNAKYQRQYDEDGNVISQIDNGQTQNARGIINIKSGREYALSHEIGHAIDHALLDHIISEVATVGIELISEKDHEVMTEWFESEGFVNSSSLSRISFAAVSEFIWHYKDLPVEVANEKQRKYIETAKGLFKRWGEGDGSTDGKGAYSALAKLLTGNADHLFDTTESIGLNDYLNQLKEGRVFNEDVNNIVAATRNHLIDRVTTTVKSVHDNAGQYIRFGSWDFLMDPAHPHDLHESFEQSFVRDAIYQGITLAGGGEDHEKLFDYIRAKNAKNPDMVLLREMEDDLKQTLKMDPANPNHFYETVYATEMSLFSNGAGKIIDGLLFKNAIDRDNIGEKEFLLDEGLKQYANVLAEKYNKSLYDGVNTFVYETLGKSGDISRSITGVHNQQLDNKSAIEEFLLDRMNDNTILQSDLNKLSSAFHRKASSSAENVFGLSFDVHINSIDGLQDELSEKIDQRIPTLKDIAPSLHDLLLTENIVNAGSFYINQHVSSFMEQAVIEQVMSINPDLADVKIVKNDGFNAYIDRNRELDGKVSRYLTPKENNQKSVKEFVQKNYYSAPHERFARLMEASVGYELEKLKISNTNASIVTHALNSKSNGLKNRSQTIYPSRECSEKFFETMSDLLSINGFTIDEPKEIRKYMIKQGAYLEEDIKQDQNDLFYESEIDNPLVVGRRDREGNLIEERDLKEHSKSRVLKQVEQENKDRERAIRERAHNPFFNFTM